MNDAGRQVFRPVRVQIRQLVRERDCKTRRNFICAGLRITAQRRPALKRQRIGTRQAKIGARAVQPRERVAHHGAMARVGTTHGHAFQKGDKRRRPAAKSPQRVALGVVHRQWACDATTRQMLHQAQKKGQIALRHALFIKREDEMPALHVQQVIGVLDAFRDALAGHDGPEIVAREKGREFVVADFCVDGHGLIPRGASVGVSHALARGQTGVRFGERRRAANVRQPHVRRPRRLSLDYFHPVRFRRPDGAERDAARPDP